MLKRILLTLTFIAAFATIGIVPARSADAWSYWGRPYAARYYYGPPPYYSGYAPYRTYYRTYYAPPVYDPYYRPYYAYPDRYYYSERPRVYVSFGF